MTPFIFLPRFLLIIGVFIFHAFGNDFKTSTSLSYTNNGITELTSITPFILETVNKTTKSIKELSKAPKEQDEVKEESNTTVIQVDENKKMELHSDSAIVENRRSDVNDDDLANPSASSLSTGSHGIRCYSCTNCKTITQSTPSKVCSAGIKNGQCVAFSQSYKAMNQTWWVRGCPTERGTCRDIRASLHKPDIVEVVSCRECDADLCNVAATHHTPKNLGTIVSILTGAALVNKITT